MKKSTESRWRRVRPLQTLGELMTAVALGGLVLAMIPGSRRPATARVVPAPLPGVSRALPTVRQYDPTPTDRCLIPAPSVDERFVFAPAETNDARFVVKPTVRGLLVREVDPSSGSP